MKPKAGGGRKVLEDERASFGYAFQGIAYAWSTQRHLRVHAGVAALAVLLGLALRISATDWAVLCLTIATVTALELLNTVVEAVVDLASPDFHPLAKVAKDVAAASVLVAAGGGVAVGAFLFLPRIWALLTLLGR